MLAIQYGVMHKPSGHYLRMSKFAPGTDTPVYGPLNMSWIADSEAQAIAQADLLGDDHAAVSYVAARTDLAKLAGLR